ncbi:MAG TPA: sigma-70 family RNA polymerase sigma factor [Gemmatimonadaceae bacterium]|nr:sigma-70 family RNA polymerase sigma factor [Gemmatimonadaceae bacterium]
MQARESLHRVTELDDAALVRATRAGDMDALAELYRRFAPALMAVAYRLLQSREGAEDVLHDVFVGLPEAMRKYEDRGKLAAWLKQVTARVALSAIRREDTAIRLAPVPALAHADDLHMRMTLDSAVASLPVTLRTVLVLKEIEGFSHAEIAEMLGISRGASEVRLHRALIALRAMVTKGEMSS